MEGQASRARKGSDPLNEKLKSGKKRTYGKGLEKVRMGSMTNSKEEKWGQTPNASSAHAFFPVTDVGV